MTASGSPAAWTAPSRVSMAIGSSMAIELTLKPDTASGAKLRVSSASCASDSTAGVPVPKAAGR